MSRPQVGKNHHRFGGLPSDRLGGACLCCNLCCCCSCLCCNCCVCCWCLCSVCCLLGSGALRRQEAFHDSPMPEVRDYGVQPVNAESGHPLAERGDHERQSRPGGLAVH